MTGADLLVTSNNVSVSSLEFRQIYPHRQHGHHRDLGAVNHLRHVVPAAAVLVFAAGCGGSAAQPTKAESTPAPRTQTAAQRGTVNITQSGSAAPKTMWFVRIESTDSTPLAEARFPGRPVSFSRDLPAGRYRVIAWWRACAGSCPATGEQGLGPLEDVCGAPVSVDRGRRVDAVVQISPAGGCTVAPQP